MKHPARCRVVSLRTSPGFEAAGPVFSFVRRATALDSWCWAAGAMKPTCSRFSFTASKLPITASLLSVCAKSQVERAGVEPTSIQRSMPEPDAARSRLWVGTHVAPEVSTKKAAARPLAVQPAHTQASNEWPNDGSFIVCVQVGRHKYLPPSKECPD